MEAKANVEFPIKVNIPWSDLGNWREISNIFRRNKSKYFKKSNVFYRPWGKYTNLFNGDRFLIKSDPLDLKILFGEIYFLIYL